MPTMCVASTAPSVSHVTASLVITNVTGILSGPSRGSPSPLVSGIGQPTDSVPIPSSSISAGFSYEQYPYALQNPTHNPLGSQPLSFLHNSPHYYDHHGAHIYYTGSLPPRVLVENYVPLSVA